MLGKISNISIKGISTAVPKEEFDNVKYAENTGNRKMKKSVQLTGILSRRVCTGGQTAADLASVAADDLMSSLGWKKDEIDVLIFVTQSPELQRPSTAFIIQSRLQIDSKCLVFDINQGCAGYITGLITMSGLLNQSKGKGLLLCGESHACVGDVLNGSQLLDGDAGTATALEYVENADDIPFMNFCDGSRSHLLFTRFENRGYMDGNAIMLFALEDVAKTIREFFTENNISDADIDFYAFHQAQKMLIDGIAEQINADEEKVIYSCERYGNTSSASIPLTICDTTRCRDKEAHILISGYGIGLTWGVMLIKVDMHNVRNIIETDFVYDDREKYIGLPM